MNRTHRNPLPWVLAAVPLLWMLAALLMLMSVSDWAVP